MRKTIKAYRFLIEFIIIILLLTQILPTCVYAKNTNRVYSLAICAWDAGKSGYEGMYDRLLNNKTTGYVNDKKNNHAYSYRPGNNNSSKSKFNAVLDNAFGKSKSTDLNILFFTGHSLSFGRKPVGIVLSYNNGEYACYSWRDLAVKLAQYKGRFLILLETCHAECFIKYGIKTLSSDNQKRIDAIVSCGYNETSAGGPTAGSLFTPPVLVRNGFSYGKFAYALIGGLGFWNGNVTADSNNNSDVTVKELYDYTCKKVKDIRFEMTVKLFSLDSGRTAISYPIKLDASSASLKMGDKKTLKATSGGFAVKPAWRSSNSSIASVSNGKITAKKNGTAIITASYHGKKATCKVTVTIPVAKVSLNKTSSTITKGETLTLKATILPTNAAKKTIKWTSSNTKVATVTSNGVVKGVANGTTIITAKANDGSGKKATCKITVVTSESSVPNVTDSVLKKKSANAAKFLGLTQKATHRDPGFGTNYFYIRKGRKLFDGSPYLEYYSFWPEGGHWNLCIGDKTIAFQGVKVGMAESKAKAALKKQKWTLVFSEPYYKDNKATDYFYSRTLPTEWGEEAYLNVIVKNGVVKLIDFVTDGD